MSKIFEFVLVLCFVAVEEFEGGLLEVFLDLLCALANGFFWLKGNQYQCKS